MYLNSSLISGLFLIASTSAAFTAEQETDGSHLEGIYACMQITEDQQRLLCFDEAVKQVKTAEDTGEIVTIDSRSVQNMAKDTFGFNIPSVLKLRIPTLPKFASGGANRPSELSDVEQQGGEVLNQNKKGVITKVGFVIERYKLRSNNKYRFYLANGQVWEQVNNKKFRFSKSDPQLIAEIRRAAMGSYLMQINGKGRAVRVRRIN